jgi:hypothetical protein
MRPTASREIVSLMGDALMEVYDSMAWQRASIPVEAVACAGRLNVSSGSRRATSG